MATHDKGQANLPYPYPTDLPCQAPPTLRSRRQMVENLAVPFAERRVLWPPAKLRLEPGIADQPVRRPSKLAPGAGQAAGEARRCPVDRGRKPLHDPGLRRGGVVGHIENPVAHGCRRGEGRPNGRNDVVAVRQIETMRAASRHLGGPVPDLVEQMMPPRTVDARQPQDEPSAARLARFPEQGFGLEQDPAVLTRSFG